MTALCAIRTKLPGGRPCARLTACRLCKSLGPSQKNIAQRAFAQTRPIIRKHNRTADPCQIDDPGFRMRSFLTPRTRPRPRPLARPRRSAPIIDQLADKLFGRMPANLRFDGRTRNVMGHPCRPDNKRFGGWQRLRVKGNSLQSGVTTIPLRDNRIQSLRRKPTDRSKQINYTHHCISNFPSPKSVN